MDHYRQISLIDFSSGVVKMTGGATIQYRKLEVPKKTTKYQVISMEKVGKKRGKRTETKVSVSEDNPESNSTSVIIVV